MATFFPGESHTFSEYLLVPGYSSSECVPTNVSLKTPLTRFKRGEEPAITLNIPMVSAIMQSVSGVDMGVALATEGGLSFIYGSQTPESEAAMVKWVKDYKAGVVESDSTLTPDMTMEQVLDLKERTGHSTMPVTDDGTPHGKLLGIVTSRDYRPSRDDHQAKVATFMTPREELVTGTKETTLKVANDILWDNKLNALPVVDEVDHLVGIVFRKDYDSHKSNPNEMLDANKRYMVGAGINTRDFAERVPLLIEAGADVLCICITRETKGIGRGQATALIDVCRARDESPTSRVNVNGQYMKEYWGEGSARARNWQRYDLGGAQKLSFVEGVDSYVPYAGSLKDGVNGTLYKVKSTMCNCGALSIPELQDKARLTLVSATSIVEGGAHDVVVKDSQQTVSYN